MGKSGWVLVQAGTGSDLKSGEVGTQTVCCDFFKVDLRESEKKKNKKQQQQGRAVKIPSSLYWANKYLRYDTVAVGGKEVYAIRSRGEGATQPPPPPPPFDAPYFSADDNHSYHVPNTLARLNLLEDIDEDEENNNNKKKKKRVKWETGPGMKQEARVPMCGCLDGKIYVFNLLPVSWFGEVFDPQTGEWSDLTNIIPNPTDHQISGRYPSGSLVRDEENLRFLMCLLDQNAHSVSLCAYYPMDGDGKWEFVSDVAPPFRRFWCWPSVKADSVVDGVIYFHDPESPLKKCIAAYDVSNKRWLKVVGCSTLGAKDAACFYRSMLHLGNGVLCLAGFIPCFPQKGTTTLQFLKFRTTRSSCGTQVFVSRVSMMTIPLKCSTIINFLAL